MATVSGNEKAEVRGSDFTGETLTQLYVSNVLKSVEFYKALGFIHDYYYDYQTDSYTRDWQPAYPPEYAEMVQEGIRLSMTTADEPGQVYGGGVRHYFIVEDVDSHFELVYLMEPMILARLVQEADVGPDDLILDIGCASGYSTAVLAQLGGTVVALECDDGLVETANRVLNELEVDNAAVVVGPLAEGLAKQGPYDVIFIGGRIDRVPAALLEQLTEGGRLLAVEKTRDVSQAVIYVRLGETMARRELFGANVKKLPGFETPAAFSF